MKQGYFNDLFPLIKNGELWLKERVVTEGEHGGDILSWQGDERIECYIEPFNSVLAAKEYGQSIECEQRIFCPTHPLISVGIGIFLEHRVGDPDYIVTHVKHWFEHDECLLERK